MKTRTLDQTIDNPESLRPFLAIRTEREYDAAVARLNVLLDDIGDHTDDPRYRLVETLSVLIEAHDREHRDLPEASGVEVLMLPDSDCPERDPRPVP